MTELRFAKKYCKRLRQTKIEASDLLVNIHKHVQECTPHHSTNLFLFPPYHVPTNSVAPFSADVNTHTTHNFSIRSEEELTLETSALETPVYINQFTLSNQSIKRNYLAILSNDTAPQFLQKLTLLYS